MNTRRVTLLLAILLALGTGWLTLNYINGLKNSTLANNTPRDVLVAAVDIPARTTITPNMLRATQLPTSAVERDALTAPGDASGQLSLITIPAGSQVTASKIGRPSDVGLPVRLSPGKRAVSIQIDKVKGISGLLEPGDRVDILAIPPRSGNEPQLPRTAAILRGILVLAVGASTETTSATPSPDYQNSTTVTLEVTPQQADLLASADANTTLRLALRSPRERLNSYPTESLQLPISQVAAAPQPAPAPAAAPAPPRAADPPVRSADPPHGNIMIIDGDRIGWSTSGGNQ
jgi:pilus assembly protein CpaB